MNNEERFYRKPPKKITYVRATSQTTEAEVARFFFSMHHIIIFITQMTNHKAHALNTKKQGHMKEG